MMNYTFPTIIVPIVDLDGGTFGTVKATDVYPAVDVTDVTQSPQGTTKPYQIAALMNFLLKSFGFSAYSPVIAATTANLAAVYTPGTIMASPGVGAILTNAGSLASFMIDGELGVLNQFYLIKNQIDGSQNGIYILTAIGDSISIPWVLTRASSFNQIANILNEALVYVLYGATQASTIWQLDFTEPLTIGVTSINWSIWNIIITGSGIVNVGTINQLAYYANNGNTVSGLSTANNSALLTNNIGIPGWISYTGSGLPVLNNLPIIIGGILDTNGNKIIGLGSNPSAVNFVSIANSATGSDPVISAVGSDTDIILTVQGKGVAGAAIQGKSGGTSFASGYVSEKMAFSVKFITSVSFTTGSTVNLGFLPLTGGDWDIFGNVGLSGTTVTSFAAGISLTTGTLPAAEDLVNPGTLTASTINYPVPSITLNTSGAQNVFLVVTGSGTGSMIMFGNLTARRR